MPLPFDATLKDMVQQHPRDFLGALGMDTPGHVTVLNVDLSTVTTSTDAAFAIGSASQRIIHIDFQSGPSADLHRHVLAYNVLLHRHHRVPVHSVVLLLRPRARHRNLTGALVYEALPERGRMEFKYEIIELWQRPVEELLTSSLVALPLAPLGRLPEGVPKETGLSAVIERLAERLITEAPPEEARRLLTAAFVLTGLRVRRTKAREFFRGVRVMRESDTYMAIIEEGEVSGMVRVLMRQGKKRFGPPDATVEARLRAITDPDRLESLCERVLEARDWQDLLRKKKGK